MRNTRMNIYKTGGKPKTRHRLHVSKPRRSIHSTPRGMRAPSQNHPKNEAVTATRG